jgi:hypothetical protein
MVSRLHGDGSVELTEVGVTRTVSHSVAAVPVVAVYLVDARLL